MAACRCRLFHVLNIDWEGWKELIQVLLDVPSP